MRKYLRKKLLDHTRVRWVFKRLFGKARMARAVRKLSKY